jgi:hypothetical protein
MISCIAIFPSDSLLSMLRNKRLILLHIGKPRPLGLRLGKRGQSSLAMPGNKTREYWRTVEDPAVSGGVLE